ncbi:heparinase II/III family protein, partial [bacterium]|nr:heparinase II/III family protein [bacterium]
MQDYLKRTLDLLIANKVQDLETWKKRYTESESNIVTELVGYIPPDFLVHIANIASYLYQQTNEIGYAQKTREILTTLPEYRKFIPDYLKKRVEYKNGVPVVNWFRSLPNFLDSYARTKDAGIYSTADVQTIADAAADSLGTIFSMPEWGAMNRAILRSESLMAAAATFPDYPDAGKWRKMAEIIAGDTIASWEIEDAQSYHPIWLRAYLNYLDYADQTEVYQSPVLKYYFDYFTKLLTPHGTIPEFGDGYWRLWWDEYYLILERGAKEYNSSEMKWAANRMFDRLCADMLEESHTPPAKSWFGRLLADMPEAAHISNAKSWHDVPRAGFATMLITREKWGNPDIQPQEPSFLSGDVLDEVIGKKMVFRSDWSEDATYLLLNYKDEGYFSWLQKEYLKRALAVEEEKAHHGHSDENSICLLQKNKTVLLNDGSYREMAPSGDYGAYRADIYHNRIVVRNTKKYLTQPYFEVLRNSGAYNPNLQTTKIDFQDLPEFEYSRTRVNDQRLDYLWDRSLFHHKTDDYFLVLDALKFQKSDYFTLANLFHTRQVLEQGDGWYLTHMDQIQGKFPNPGNMNLLIIFLQDKETGVEKERRDNQEELAIFQGCSQFYNAG